MAVQSVAKATIVVPRSELADTVKELTDFGLFHFIPPDTLRRDSSIDELASRANRLFIELDSLAKAYDIPIMPGLIQQIKAGPLTEKIAFSAENWANLVSSLESKAEPVLKKLGSLYHERVALEKDLTDRHTLLSTLALIGELAVDLSAIRRFRWVHAVFALTRTKNIVEIRKSLPEQVALIDSPLNQLDSAILIIGLPAEADRIGNVLKAFEVRQFEIPPDLPQNTSKAAKIIKQQIAEMNEKFEKNRASAEVLITQQKTSLLAFREAAYSAYMILSKTRNAGEMQTFAVVSGFIPANQLRQFTGRFEKKAVCLVTPVKKLPHEESPTASELSAKPPTLTANRGFVKAHENIALMQGSATYGELDPSPIISFVFPIFWGIMFGDLGDGLVLFLMGFVLTTRCMGSVREWGQMFALAGIASMGMGLLDGEFFGFPVLQHYLGPPFLELVNKETGQFITENVLFLFEVSLVIGIFHLMLGHLINIRNMINFGEKHKLITVAVPTTCMYVFGIIFGVGFIYAGYSFDALLSSPRPMGIFAGLPIKIVMPPVLVGLFGSMIGLIAGRPIFIATGRGEKGETIGAALGDGALEVFENISRMASNTISYVRLAILLVVHAALRLTANMIWLNLGIISLPIMIGLGAGIFALEALVVFVQDLRLHVYEWFTKFYRGEGEAFEKIIPDLVYGSLIWKK